MKKAFTLLYLIAGFAITCRCQTYPLRSGVDYKPGTVIIKMLPQYRDIILPADGQPPIYRLADPTLQNSCAAFGPYTVRLLYPHHVGRKAGSVDLSLVGELQFEETTDVPAICRQLMKTGRLEYAEPRILYKKTGEFTLSPGSTRPVALGFIPNDSLVSEQWHLNNIRAFDAWEIEQGDTSVIIGIIDDGVDYLHPDLAANIAVNHADPVNGLDDDNNGFVDDYFGWDLFYNDNDPAPAAEHGTGVAGMASAVTNNGIGLAAPGFNSRVLAIKCSSDDPDDNNISYGYEGIVYAADRGCRVINCSWGGPIGGGLYLDDIMRYATFDKNAMVVAAAGNENNSEPFFPAYTKFVLGVASVDPADVKKPNSNFNHLVDIAAPSTIWAPEPGGFYFSNFGGTSAASPLVAGTAALLAAHDTSLTALQLGERLRLTADNIDAQNPSFVEQLGGGRLNMHRALADAAIPAVRFMNVVFTDGNDNNFVEGDTVRLSGVFINYLANTNDLVVTISTPNPNITVLENSFLINSLPTMGEVNNTDEPFTFVIGPNIPPDTELPIRLGFQAPGYDDWQWVTASVNRTRLNISTEILATTIYSDGNIAYDNDWSGSGIGLQYFPNSGVEGVFGLMLGNSNTRVSDAALNNWALADIMSEDFIVTEAIHAVPPPLDANMAMTCAFNDSGVFLPLYRMDVSVRQNVYAWLGDHFIITEYEVTNNSANSYNSFHIGLWGDIFIVPGEHNRGEQDASLNLGYVYSIEDGAPFFGLQLLSQSPANVYYIESTPDFGSVDISGNFSSSEKYTTLSQSRPAGGFGDADGDDMYIVVSSGSNQLAPGNTIKVAFAILVADSLEALRAAAENAITRYDNLNISTQTNEQSRAQPLKIFPNPTGDMIWMEAEGLSDSSNTIVELYDLSGKTISRLTPAMEGQIWAVRTGHLPAGIYLLRLRSEAGVRTGKFVKN
ncbi:MAG: S8 family serine peptidase [Saprospiraceae bacterium]|nr:S8 family serine peptidase [Saprospiraceae bacterium]